MYWTRVPHLSQKDDSYGFVDENEVRIATGITLVLALFTFFLVVLKGNYSIPLIMVSIILLDFLLKLISPQLSLFWSFVRIFLKKGSEVWVGAVQKRFAWSIGLVLVGFVLFCILMLGGYTGMVNPIMQAIWDSTANNIASGALIVTPMNPTILACLLCIVFMWSESVVGYCVGCHIYGWLVKKWWMREYKWQNCVNGVCEMK